MIIFDEKKYAEKILRNKKYDTLRNQGQERCSIVRYLHNEGYNNSDIKSILRKIPIHRGDFLSDDDKDKIYERIINKATSYEYIHDIQVKIYKSEIDIINSVEDENSRNLLFCYLVYYKWGKNIYNKSFYSKKKDVNMVIEDDNNIWKLAKLSKIRKKDRYALYNYFISNNYYCEEYINKHNYFLIPFVKEDGQDVVITIDNYDNILGELYLYNNVENYKRCENCGVVIKKNNNKQKYCKNCSKYIIKEKDKERKKIHK